MERILIVDDALFARKKLSDILKKEGFDIVGEADNAKDAIENFKKLRPDLVTMDIIMPEIDGIDAITAVREIIKIDPQAKIIMVSAMSQQNFIVETIQAGAKDFIAKPYLASDVARKVWRLLKEGR